MYNKVKLTKRQIKEDKFTAFVLRSKDQFMDNWQFFVIGVVLVVLIIVGGIYYINSKKSQEIQSAERYARAVADYRSGNKQVALASLNQILDNNADKIVVEEATYMLGNINYEQRNYPEAIRFWEMYVSKYHDDSLTRAASLAGIAACHENQGEYKKAAAKYLEAIDAFPDGPLEGDYREAVIRNFLADGDIKQARAQLDTLKEKAGNTDLYNRVARYFSEYSRS